MAAVPHVVFGTGAIGFALYEALRRRGETVRLVNRSGRATPRCQTTSRFDAGDAGDPALPALASR